MACVKGGEACRIVFTRMGRIESAKRPEVVVHEFKCGVACKFRCTQEVELALKDHFDERFE